MVNRPILIVAVAGVALLSGCERREPPDQVFAQCRIMMAEATHTPNLNDVDWSSLDTCMESKGYTLDTSLADCGKLNGPAALAKCYRPISN
jgi:transcriptional regulatory protein LevR